MAVYKNITKDMAEDLLDRAFIKDNYAELIPQLMQLQGPIPDDFVSQYLITYQDRVNSATKIYSERLKEIDDDIEEIRSYYKEDLEKEYTPEQEQKDREELVEQAEIFLNRSLLIAHGYKNDLENYAYALLEEWKKSGGVGSLV